MEFGCEVRLLLLNINEETSGSGLESSLWDVFGVCVLKGGIYFRFLSSAPSSAEFSTNIGLFLRRRRGS